MDVQNAVAIVGGLMGIAGTITALFAFIYKRGSHEASSDASLSDLKTKFASVESMLKDAAKERQEQFRELEQKLDKRIVTVDERFDKVDGRVERLVGDLERRISAQQALITLSQQQRNDDKQFLLENYMKVEDIRHLEDRMSKGYEKLATTLEDIRDRLDRLIEGVPQKLLGHRSS